MGWLIILLCLLVLAAGGTAFCIWQNNALERTDIEYVNEKLPEAFDGFRIVHISDLHNKWFGERQKLLRAMMAEASPDTIVLTGDLIDKRRCRDGDYGAAVTLAGQAGMLAPVHYVTGNHEWQDGSVEDICGKLAKEAVSILENKATVIRRGEEQIVLMGVSDISRYNGGAMRAPVLEKEKSQFSQVLHEMKEQHKDDFCILLSHRPELLPIYVREHIDLVFCGHAHGGQVRLPFVGALFAPGQGMLPKYTEGLCKEEGTSMVISRGLGNSLFPARVFNRPEVVTVTLYRKKP